MVAQNDDESSYGPDVQREQKLHPSFPVCVKIYPNASFNSEVQVKPSNKHMK